MEKRVCDIYNEKLPRLGRRRWLAQLGAEVGQRERE